MTTTTIAHNLTPRADKRIRIVAIVGALIVSVAAFALSFEGLRSLGEQSGLGHLSALLPIAVDGMMIVGAMLVLRNSLLAASVLYGWVLTILGVSASTAGNMLAASPGSTPAQLAVHASFPILYALTFEALLSVIRRDVASAAQVEAERLAQEQAAAAKAEKIRQDEERAAAREAARLAAPASSATTSTPPRGTRTVRARATAGSGGSSVVEEIQAVVEALPEGMTQTPTATVIEILRAVPHATRGDIDSAGVFDDSAPSALRNAYSRAQKRIAEESADSSAPAHVLHAV